MPPRLTPMTDSRIWTSRLLGPARRGDPRTERCVSGHSRGWELPRPRTLNGDFVRGLVFLEVDWASLWVLPTPGAGGNRASDPYSALQVIQVETKRHHRAGRQMSSSVVPRASDPYWGSVYVPRSETERSSGKSEKGWLAA